MNAVLVNIIALQFIVALLAAIMLIAWRSFGRPRHALVWAMAFSIATAAWSVDLAMRLFFLDSRVLYALAAGLACLSDALIAIGFIQRARGNLRLRPMIGAAAASAAVIGIASALIPHPGLRDATWLSFAGVMLVVSGIHVARSDARSLPERAAAAMLILFAAINFGMAAMAIGDGFDGADQNVGFFRLGVMLLYPPAFVGVGLFAVFLVAADLAENMRNLAVSDLLTGIYNRRGFEEAADRAIRNAQRQQQPLTLVVSDIDRFKTINDRYGHVIGDRAIQHFTRRMLDMVRRSDLIGRIGGEEFALLLVNTGSTEAIEVVERIRMDIATTPVTGTEGISMTASFGLTDLRPEDTALASMFARADRALYRAKIDGRNRIACAETMPAALTPQDRVWVTSDPA